MGNTEIDRSIWKEWEDIEAQGAENFTVELFEVFQSTSQNDLAGLNDAMDKQDLKSIAHVAHSLKGSCKQIGAQQLVEELNTLEREARTGPGPIAKDCMVSINSRFASVHEEIASEIKLRRAK